MLQWLAIANLEDFGWRLVALDGWPHTGVDLDPLGKLAKPVAGHGH